MSFYLTLSLLILSFVIHAVLTVRLDSDSKQLMGGCFNETRPLNCSDFGYPGYSVVDTSEHNKWCCVSFNDDDDFDSVTTTVFSKDEETKTVATATTVNQSQPGDFNKFTAINEFEASTTTVALTTTNTIQSIDGSYNDTSSDSISESKESSTENANDSESFEKEKQRESSRDSLQATTTPILSETLSVSEKYEDPQSEETLSNKEIVEETSTNLNFPTTLHEDSSTLLSSSEGEMNETQDLLAIIAPVDSVFNGILELVVDSDPTESPTTTVQEETTTVQGSETIDIKKTESLAKSESSPNEEITSVPTKSIDKRRFKARKTNDESEENTTSQEDVNGNFPNESSDELNPQNNKNDDSVVTTAFVTSVKISSMTEVPEETSTPTTIKVEDINSKVENEIPEDTNKDDSSTMSENSSTSQTKETTDEDVSTEQKASTNEITSFVTTEAIIPPVISSSQSTTLQTIATTIEQVEETSMSSIEGQTSESSLLENDENLQEQQPTAQPSESMAEGSDLEANLVNNEVSEISNDTEATSTKQKELNSSPTKAPENLQTTVVQQASSFMQENEELEEVFVNETTISTSSSQVEEKITQVPTQSDSLFAESRKQTELDSENSSDTLQTKPINSTKTMNANNFEPSKADENTLEINDSVNKPTRSSATAKPLIHIKAGRVKANLF